MKDSRRVWAWVGVAVVVIVVAAWIIWKPQSPQQQAGSSPMPVYASQGQLVPQFPAGLIVDPNAAISGSYSISYASSTNQYTAEYDSSSTVAALYGKYQSYLPQNGWTIASSLTTDPAFDVLSAYQGNSQLQVVIENVDNGSQVTVSYLIK